MAEHEIKDEARTAAGERGIAAAAPASLAGAAKMPALRQVPFFAGVPEEALMVLAARSRWQVYAPGEVVLDSGDRTDEVFFIAEGAVRVGMRTAVGYELILNDLGAGSFFGELEALDGLPRAANVTALQRSRLCAVPGPAFMDVVLNAPVAGQRLLRLMAVRQRATSERLLEFMALPVRQRLMAELLRLSRDRGGGERALSPPPQQYVLAARIGSRRRTVSREMAEMARSGLLSITRRTIVLHRPEALQAEIQERLTTKATITEVPHARPQLQTSFTVEVGNQTSGEESTGGQVSPAPEEIPEERLAAEAVDRMIAKLDVATATVEAQLAELRHMHRAA